jgi:hypothetical protein
MLGRLGFVGVLGVVFILGGIALVALESLVIAGGIALVIAGFGLAVYGIVTNLLGAFGMGGLV